MCWATALPSRIRAVTWLIVATREAATSAEPQLPPGGFGHQPYDLRNILPGFAGDPPAVFVLGGDVDGLAAELLDLDARSPQRRLNLDDPSLRQDPLHGSQAHSECRAVAQEMISQAGDELGRRHHAQQM